MVLVLRHNRKGEAESSGAAAAVVAAVVAAVAAAVAAVAAKKFRRVMGVDIMTRTFWGESMETGIFVAGDPRATGSSQHLIFAVIQELGSFRASPVL